MVVSSIETITSPLPHERPKFQTSLSIYSRFFVILKVVSRIDYNPIIFFSIKTKVALPFSLALKIPFRFPSPMENKLAALLGTSSNVLLLKELLMV